MTARVPSLARDLNRAHARAHARIHELVRNLNSDRTRTRACARNLDRACARADALVIAFTNHHISGFRDLDPASGLDRMRVHRLIPDLNRDLAHARGLVRDLGRDLHRDRLSGMIWDYFRDRASGREQARTLAVGLVYALRRARATAQKFIAAGEVAPPTAPGRQVGRTRKVRKGDPARVAVQVAGLASGLLPGRDRDRFAEEYRSELAGLATIGAGR